MILIPQRKRKNSHSRCGQRILSFLLTLTLAVCLSVGNILLPAGNVLNVSAETVAERIEAQQAMEIQSNETEGWPEGPVVTAEAAILIEAETGTILYAKNIHKQEYPASTTKLLTCLIAWEQCEMDEMVVMSYDAIYDTPSDSNNIALDVGESITMEQALNAILIRSANEVAYAVAEHISGTTWEDFADIMNQRAEELGCLNSHFVNPNGLPDEDHYTTAYDLAQIARAFFDNEYLSKISRTTTLYIPASDTQPDEIIEHTKNKLLAGQSMAYEYLVGSKTGYTSVARQCLVTCAEKDGMKLICVVLRDEGTAHYEDTLALFDYGFENFQKVNVSESESAYQITTVGTFSDNDILGSSQTLLSLNTEDFIVLPVTASFADTESMISYDTEEEGQAALITYTYNGVTVGSASVDFVITDTEGYSFTAAESTSSEEASLGSDSEAESEAADSAKNTGNKVIYINILQILLRVIVTIVVLFVLFLLILLLRKYLVRRARARRRRRGATNLSMSSSLQQKRRESARRARSRRRHSGRGRNNRYRD